RRHRWRRHRRHRRPRRGRDGRLSESSSLAPCCGDPDRSLPEHFGRAPFRWSGPPPDDLLSLADVDRLLGEGALRWPAVRVVRDGEAIERARWTRQAGMGSVTVDALVDARRLLDLYADGCTIVLQSLHRWWPPLAGVFREIEPLVLPRGTATAY